MKISKPFNFEEIKGFSYGFSPLGKPFLYVNTYFIDGLLIDTAQPRMRKAVLKDISKLNVKQIFLTHFHEDHSGNLNALQNHFNCPVYGSSLTAKIMQKPPRISLAQNIFWGNRPANKQITVKEDYIETEKYHFEVIPIPGHAKDMVALYEAKQGWLFSADLYIHSYISYFIDTEDIATQIQSIKRVLQLDFDVLLCAHNPQFKNGKEKLHEKLNFLQQFFDSVENVYKKYKTPKQIFKYLNLKEKRLIKWASGGSLSKLNMVKSVIRNIEKQQSNEND